MPEQDSRLGAAIRQRCEDLGLGWRELAARASVSTETLRALRRGANSPRPRTARAIERALEWEPGSVKAVLQGGTPTPIKHAGASALGSEVGLSEDDPRYRALQAILDTLTPDEQKEAIRRYQERLGEPAARNPVSVDRDAV